MKTFKQILEARPGRYYAEIRFYDEDGSDYIHDTFYDRSVSSEAVLKKAIRFSKKNFKGEGKIKINIFDTDHPNGIWNVDSKEIKV